MTRAIGFLLAIGGGEMIEGADTLHLPTRTTRGSMIGVKAMRRTAVLTLTLVAAITMATPALAACGLTPESVARAEVVFVGQLADVSPDGNSATFRVEEIWRGGGLVMGEAVEIDTTNSLQRLELPPPGAPASRYLVLANTLGGQLHTGDSCELFPFPWDASYAALRPADAPPPPGSDSDAGAGPPPAVLLAAAAFIALGVVGFLAFRRGSPA
jgi:hypothetical protein